MIILREQVENLLKELGLDVEIKFGATNNLFINNECSEPAFSFQINDISLSGTRKLSKREREIVWKKIEKILRDNVDKIKENIEIVKELSKVRKELHNLEYRNNEYVKTFYGRYSVYIDKVEYEIDEDTKELRKVDMHNAKDLSFEEAVTKERLNRAMDLFIQFTSLEDKEEVLRRKLNDGVAFC